MEYGFKYKFINSGIEDKKSYVTIKKNGVFYRGIAHFNPADDEKYFSKFVGCEIAEKRAFMKALKAEKNRLRDEAKVLNDVLTICACDKYFDPLDRSVKKIYKQMMIRHYWANRYHQRYYELKDEIKKKVESIFAVEKMRQHKAKVAELREQIKDKKK